MPRTASVPSADYDGSYSIAWAASSTATKYTLLERVNGGSWTTLTSTHTSTSYSRSGRSSAAYQYAVKACNASGCSGYKFSNTITVTIKPSVPANLRVIHEDDFDFTVTWNAASRATRYTVLERQSTTSSWSTVQTNNNKHYYSSQKPPGTTWYYKVNACNVAGCSTYTAEVLGYLHPLPPPGRRPGRR